MLKLEYNYNHYKWPTLLLCDTNYWWGDDFLCQSGYVHESLLNKSKFGITQNFLFYSCVPVSPSSDQWNNILFWPNTGCGEAIPNRQIYLSGVTPPMTALIEGTIFGTCKQRLVPGETFANEPKSAENLTLCNRTIAFWQGCHALVICDKFKGQCTPVQQFWSFCRKTISILFLYPPTVLIAYSP